MWREDVWFEQLPDNDARLLWVYLFTNPSSPMTGLYRLTLRSIANETYISQEKTAELLEMFARDGKAYYDQERGVIFVVNMQRLQFENVSPNMARRMQKDIDAIPDCELKQTYLTKYGYPMIIEYMDGSKKRERVEYRYPWDDDKQGSDSLSIPYEYPIDRGATTETETETKQQPNENVRVAVAAWESLGLTINPFTFQQLAAAVDEWSESGHPEYVTLAIEEAGRQNKRSWAYVEGILKRCRAEGTAPIYTNGETKKAAPKIKAGTQFIRNPSPDGTEWIYYDTVTKEETRREPRASEEIF